MNQAFYAVQERDKDICFASDHGRIWSYQKESGEFTLIELPTKKDRSPPFIPLHRTYPLLLPIRMAFLPTTCEQKQTYITRS